MTKTELDYIQILITGEEKGLRKIYADFLPRISYFITTHGGTRDDAKDVFQDALMIIFQKAEEGQFELTSGFYTLLYGVVRKVWRNRLRKKSNTEVTFPEDRTFSTFEGIEEKMIQEEKGKIFWMAFRKLGEDCQRVMQYFFERKKMEEIVQLMQYSSVSYAKKRKFQCKEKLIKLAKEDNRYPEFV